MRERSWTRLVCTTALGVLTVMAAPAAAQTSGAAPGEQDTTAAGPSEENGNDIVVIARKQSERLQDVPLSISAVPQDALRRFNATRLNDVAAFVPGLQIDSQTGQPGSTNITLRGLTTASLNSTTTATTIDGVPIGSSSAYAFAPLNGTDLLPYDVDRIEVLRGPQGTLYGANSLGGLVQYVTPTPDLTQLSGRVGADLTVVDHDGSDLGNAERALINVPIVTDQLGINASFGRVYSAGYIDNSRSGERAYNHGVQEGGGSACSGVRMPTCRCASPGSTTAPTLTGSASYRSPSRPGSRRSAIRRPISCRLATPAPRSSAMARSATISASPRSLR
jgi:outer membrane receptor protein involved in Fe transport